MVVSMNKSCKGEEFNKMKKFTLILSLIFFSQISLASVDVYWKGNYSLEGNYLNSVDLGNEVDGDKAYLNHRIFIQPELIFFEGLSFHGGLDVLNGTGSLPPSHRLGQILGGDLEAGSGSYVSDVPAPFLDRQLQKSRWINLSEAYLKYSHTHGELRVGRIPLEFGYGAFFNAGHALFDHWYSNRDGIAYKFTIGSLMFEPYFGFLTDPMSEGGETTEYGLKFNFHVEDTGLDLGALLLFRHIPKGQNTNDALGANFGAASTESYGLYYNKKLKNMRYGFEALFQGGDVGLNAAGEEVSLKGYGLAAEFEWNLKDFDLFLKAGAASGEDSNPNSISSVAFHKNYDLGLILFNHPLGASSYDPLNTNARGRRGSLSETEYGAAKVVDTESISNAYYIAPSFSYNFDRAWSLQTTLVTAWLEESNFSYANVSSYLGSEIDLTLTYKPTENITHRTTVGFFMPGAAFDWGSFNSKNCFGATTGLGINF